LLTFDENSGETETAVWIVVPEKASAIRVDASWDWVNRKWTQQEISSPEAAIQTGRLTMHLKQPSRVRFTKRKAIKLGIRKCLISGDAITKFVIQSVPDVFAVVVNRLAKVASKVRLRKQRFTTSLSQFILSAREIVSYDFERFKQLGGCFKLEFQSQEARDKMRAFEIGEVEWSLVGGLYIHPFAASILESRERNGIAGLTMDTTWSVIS
jgi:hypothetical protein